MKLYVDGVFHFHEKNTVRSTVNVKLFLENKQLATGPFFVVVTAVNDNWLNRFRNDVHHPLDNFSSTLVRQSPNNIIKLLSEKLNNKLLSENLANPFLELFNNNYSRTPRLCPRYEVRERV